MIKTANDKILVEVDYSQKKEADIGGVKMQLSKQFSSNRRESNPVVCRVITGNKHIKDGEYLLVHHNRFVENSPHHLGENLYSLEYNRSIFAKILEDGSVRQMCGNIVVDRIYSDNSKILPDSLRKHNPHKFLVKQDGHGLKSGQFVFCYKFSDYEIVYVFSGKEHRIVKVYKDDIVGKLISN